MIRKALWNTTRMLSMVFEVIQPNLEINRRHAAALPIPVQASSVRAASGSSVEGFGQILAAALRPAGQLAAGSQRRLHDDGALLLPRNDTSRLRCSDARSPIAGPRHDPVGRPVVAQCDHTQDL